MLEAEILFILSAVQFINMLDYMMVMPLGPDFAKALGFSVAHIGYVGGTYTLAAGLSSLVLSPFLDRWDRKTALLVFLFCLSLGTLAGAYSSSLYGLLLTRVWAGACGGPATSLTYAILADAIPPERRGRAMGVVLSSFSISSVLGVPISLELAEWGSWQTPFYAVAATGVLIGLYTFLRLPSFRKHLSAIRQQAASLSFWKPKVYWAYFLIGLAMFGSFLVIPNISGYFQYTLGYPRSGMSLLYLIGGGLTFFSMRWIGRWIDRVGAARVIWWPTLAMLVTLSVGYISYWSLLPPLVIFVAFMVSTTARGVCVISINSLVPNEAERARFMSLQTAVQHFASAFGGLASAQILYQEDQNGPLLGMNKVGILAALVTATVPLIVQTLSKRLKESTG